MKNKDNISKIKYIGYYEMLDKINHLMDKGSYEDKMALIDRYIEILKIVTEAENEA